LTLPIPSPLGPESPMYSRDAVKSVLSDIMSTAVAVPPALLVLKFKLPSVTAGPA
jgi:hypothetical protein